MTIATRQDSKNSLFSMKNKLLKIKRTIKIKRGVLLPIMMQGWTPSNRLYKLNKKKFRGFYSSIKN